MGHLAAPNQQTVPQGGTDQRTSPIPVLLHIKPLACALGILRISQTVTAHLKLWTYVCPIASCL